MQPLQYFLKPVPETDNFKGIPVKCLKELDNFNGIDVGDEVVYVNDIKKKLRQFLSKNIEFISPNISMLQLVPDEGTMCPKCETFLDEERIAGRFVVND